MKGRASGNGGERQGWRNGEGKDRCQPDRQGCESLDVPRRAVPGAGFLEGMGGRVSARAPSYHPGGACGTEDLSGLRDGRETREEGLMDGLGRRGAVWEWIPLMFIFA